MTDSPQSDADKIRTKRLAKLGTAGVQLAPGPEPSSSKDEAGSRIPQTKVEDIAGNIVMNSVSTLPSAAKPHINSTFVPTLESNTHNLRPELFEVWEDHIIRSIFRVTLVDEEVFDANQNHLIYLAATKEDLKEQNLPLLLSLGNLEGAISEAASHAPGNKSFAYLLASFKRVCQSLRPMSGMEIATNKLNTLKEVRRLCASYCFFAVTIPDMFFAHKVASPNPFLEHLLADPGSEIGICTEFLAELQCQLDENESAREALISAAEGLSHALSGKDMLSDYLDYFRALRNLSRFPKIVETITQSSLWVPQKIAAETIETHSFLGPFFRISPMQHSVAQNYFPASRSGDAGFVAGAQHAIRLSLRTLHSALFGIVDSIVRSGPIARGHMLDWFALCVNLNHRKRAMRVDANTVSTDGFVANVTVVLDQLCEPFMDAQFGKIEKIDVDYLRRNPRLTLSDETKINADQKQAEDFYASKLAGNNNFISEVFFLAVAAHHYGAGSVQTRMIHLRKTMQRRERDLEALIAERSRYENNNHSLTQFERYVSQARRQIEDDWSTIHATNSFLLDDVTRARSAQSMRYLIVWLLRLASRQDLPTQKLVLPLPHVQTDVFRCLPEYFLEDIVDNFKFITSHIPQIIVPQQCEEVIQICITFLRSTEYVKNPGIKSGLVSILFYGVQPLRGQQRGVLGDTLLTSSFAHRHLLHALMRFYIEAESTGSHTQFYDKFNIRYEIFQIIKRIWENAKYGENLAKEAAANTEFFVKFVNMLVNDATFVLDESLSSFVKIRDLRRELASPDAAALNDEERQAKEALLEDQKNKAKSYMGLTRETMEALELFTKTLATAFTMPEIVQRLADMLDYNLDIMVGPKSVTLKVGENRVEMQREFNFDPGALLKNIVSVFINLAKESTFITAIARDGRSYKPQIFDKAIDILSHRSLASPEELSILGDLANAVRGEKKVIDQEEEDLGDVPEEFLDPLLSEIMVDPVILPRSRNTVDRSTIRSHLLSDSTDPFNRMPLKIEDVVPNIELKQRIDAWKIERRAARKARR